MERKAKFKIFIPGTFLKITVWSGHCSVGMLRYGNKYYETFLTISQ